jgi:UDP-N-acetylmuramate--alanine ligase
MSEFGRCFHDANVVIVADIYASAREHDTLGITSETLIEHIHTTGKNALYAHGYDDVIQHLEHQITDSSDVVVFMGAGDIADWSRKYCRLEVGL